MDDLDSWGPPLAFFFKVSFEGGDNIPDTSFHEVSGISMEMSMETRKANGLGGVPLPRKKSGGMLTLKRPLHPLSNPLEKWINDCLDPTYNKKITPLLVTVSLLQRGSAGEEPEPLASWSFSNVYVSRWSCDPFHSDKSMLVEETLQFYYQTIKRLL